MLVATLAAGALAGCGGNYAAHGAVSTGGAVVVDGGLTVSIGLSETAANVIAAGGIISILAAGNNLSPLPPRPMRTDRTINEQDCTKPIVTPTANLRCR